MKSKSSTAAGGRRLSLHSRNQAIQRLLKRCFDARPISIDQKISTEWLWRMSIRAGQSSFHFLLAIAAGLTCAAALAIGLTIWWLRADAIADASKDSDNLATVLAHQLDNSVQSIDLILTEIKDQEKIRAAQEANNFDRVLRGEDMYQFLMERLSRLQQAEFIGLVDKNGILVSTTRQWPTPKIDLSDRTYFLHFKNNDDKSVYISNHEVDRLNGSQVVFFSKRINGDNNTFLGVAVIGVRLTYFQQIYESIASLSDEAFLLLHHDGTIIVRYPDPKNREYEKMPTASPWHQLVLQGGGQYRSPGYFDNKARLVAVHPLRDYPLVVNIGVAEAAALATWHKQAITLGAGALLFMLCVTFLLKAQSKQFRRLATSEATVDAALNNMSQGLVMFDSSNRLVVCNRRYLEMYGLSPDIVKPGSPLRELLDHRVAIGNFGAADVEPYITDLLAAVDHGITFSKITSLPNGRIFSVVNQPTADGGWVAAHEDVTEQKRAEQRIAHMAHYDTLTDLPNRAAFKDSMAATLDRAAATGEQFAVLSIDLDHFKEANDTYGHLVGDALLNEVARRLQAAAGGTFVARIGGDEFAVIVADGEQPAAAEALAERLLAAFADDFEVEGHKLKLGLSIGAAIYPTDGTDAKTLMVNADATLYRAKAETRGAVMFFEPEMGFRLRERHALREDLRSAINRGELLLHYQPQKKMSGETIGFEALVRWQCPKRGMVLPGTFIAVAEESNLILPLGEWVLREACREAASWPQPLTIAVNISPIQFRQGDLPRLVHSILLQTGLAPRRLELEITEGVMINDFSRAVSILRRLKSLGIKIAMDDFGTGYSSLSYLQSFSFDKIKIDRVFICDLEHNHHSRAIVRAVVGLGQSLYLPTLAEGVETEAQHSLLMKEGCDEVQGYLTGRPLPISDYADLVGLQAVAQKSYRVAG
jgi:diguanylate cyclase (GGDEF)-like protein